MQMTGSARGPIGLGGEEAQYEYLCSDCGFKSWFGGVATPIEKLVDDVSGLGAQLRYRDG